jgi:hypothetical protein
MKKSWLIIGLGAATVMVAAFLMFSAKSGRRSAPISRVSAPSERLIEVEEPAPSQVEEEDPNVKLAHLEPALEPSRPTDEPEGEPEVSDDKEDGAKPPSARELHMPIIRAIRENHTTPEARKNAMLRALRESGPTSEPWTEQGRHVFDDWEQAIPSEVHRATLQETTRCYRAGCEIAVRFASREDAEKAAEAFRTIAEPSAQHGGRIQTPAVNVGDGAYEANWIMLRPES